MSLSGSKLFRPLAGFTLIELLIVVAIIAILAAIAVPNLLQAQTRSKTSKVLNDQRIMASALELYRTDNRKYPPALNPFLNPSAVTQTWRLTTPIAYIETVPKDTFFQPTELPPLGGPFGPAGEFLHYIADPVVTEAWLVWSYGPDGDMEFDQIEYDPTNGTLSNGDIYRVGSLE